MPRPLPSSAAAAALTVLFAGTLFVSAALLFLVEPMFARMVLPLLGGSPAVWNTCVVFFQAVMLAGYGYAHLTSRWLSLRQQAALHVALVALAGSALPVAIPEGWVPPVDHSPVPALLLLLLAALGAPFFVVSSTAPLLQKWFSQTSHPAAQDPYFLYAASNLGSLLALVAYPFVVEPRWPLSAQSVGWAGAYAAFVLLVAAGAAATLRWSGRAGASRGGAAAEAAPSAGDHVTWRRRARWVALSAIPSSLMLAVTTYLSTDVAAVPLLWIVPLTLYLLSFVVVFATRPLLAPRWALAAMTALVPLVVVPILVEMARPMWLLMPLHVAAFFACALVLHGRLAADRPATRHLTEFYLWISIGGLIGGSFNTLVAPFVFDGIVEYPLALVVACALRPAQGPEPKAGIGGVLLPLALGGVTAGLLLGGSGTGALIRVALTGIGVGTAVTLYVACSSRPLRMAAAVGAVLLAGAFLWRPQGTMLHAERSFFGVLRVFEDRSGQRRGLMHGSTLHGEQRLDPARRDEPTSYYYRQGPMGQYFGALSGRLQRVGVLGLGIGGLAAYAQPGQKWTFYELDPAVERIARMPAFFTYLDECGAQCEVVLGDGRLSLAAARPGEYDTIVLDAFSSDSIPMHLMTRQAFELYLSKLADTGILAVHISNNHLALRPVVLRLASELGLESRTQLHEAEGDGRSSEWVLAARTEAALGALAHDSRWKESAERASRVWTDDYANILSVLK